jgi:hypothetical protein
MVSTTTSLLFHLEARGHPYSQKVLILMLNHDIPYLRDRLKLTLPWYPPLTMHLFITPTPWVATLQCWEANSTKWVYSGMLLMVVQDLFCALERRGYQVRYVAGIVGGVTDATDFST